MKGNIIMKKVSKVILTISLIFVFLCTPVTKLFSKITKVFADTEPEITDVEGKNLKVVGFEGEGTVGSKVYLPKVTIDSDATEYNAKDSYDNIVYDIKAPGGRTSISSEDIESDSKGYYFIPTKEGSYVLDIYTKTEGELKTAVSGLHIRVTKPEVSFTVNKGAVVKFGDTANILPEKITLAELANTNFKLDAPKTEGDVSKIVVTCTPAGSTGATDNYTLEWDSDHRYSYFNQTSIDSILSKAKYGKYTFHYAYVVGGVTLQETSSTVEVVKDETFEEDITLAFGSMKSGSELSAGEIGKWVTLPTATIYNSESGSTDEIPAILSIKVTPSSEISDAKVEQDGYTFKANKIGKYLVTYEAKYPYTDITATKKFTIELKDTTAPEVIFAGDYEKRADWFAKAENEAKGEEDYLEYIESINAPEVKTIYVLSNGTAKIDIPAIYAKDNSTDGNYKRLVREVKFGSDTTEVTADINDAVDYPVSQEGVYELRYTAEDASGKTTIAKKIVVVLSENSIKNFGEVDTLQEVAQPKIDENKITQPRLVYSNGTFSVTVPTATDSIAKKIKDAYSKLNNTSYSSWSSNVQVTTTIQGYKTVLVDEGTADERYEEEMVSGVNYTFTEDDIVDGKYTITMAEHPELINDDVEYFKLSYSAKADWMTDAIVADVITSESKIKYVNVEEDLTAASIATARYNEGIDEYEASPLLSVLVEYNAEKIQEVIDNFNSKNPTNTIANSTISGAGMLTAANGKTIAPFNQYSAENNYKVTLPDFIITDNEDSDTLAVTTTLTDSLGNTKSIACDPIKVNEAVVNGATVYQHVISLGSYELATAGMYTVTVTATDKGGNISTYSFAIMVNDTTGPSDVVLDTDIIGDSTISKKYYTAEQIIFPEAKVIDNSNKPCTYTVKLTSTPDGAKVENISRNGFTPYTAGTYQITYFCEDSDGNKFEKVYSLEVTAKDHTTIVVNGDDFKALGGNTYSNGYSYVFDDSKTTNKIVIPSASTSNAYETSKDGQHVKPTVKKNSVTQTVVEDGDNYSFNATQGVYTVEYKYGTVTKTYTLYVGDTEAPTIKWNEEIPSSLKLNSEWGKGINEMFTVTDYKLGAENNDAIEIDRIEIIDPDNNVTIVTGENNYKFSKEGTYKIKVVANDGVNDLTSGNTKEIKVSSEEGDVDTNPTNVVGTILLIASILVVGGVVLYLIFSSKKRSKKDNK